MIRGAIAALAALLWILPAMAQGTSTAAAVPPIPLDAAIAGKPLGPYMTWMADDTGTMSIEAARAADVAGQFKQASGLVPSLGNVPGAVWVRFTIVPGNAAAADWFLVLSRTRTDSVTLYHPKGDNGWAAESDGLSQPISSRPFASRLFPFQITPPVDEGTTYYVRIAHQGNVLINLRLWPASEFFRLEGEMKAFLGVLFGILLSIAAYLAVIRHELKGGAISWLIGFILSISIYIGSISGFGRVYLWGDFPAVSILSMNIGAFLAVAAATMFARAFLELPSRDRLGSAVSQLSALFFVVAALASMIAPGPMAEAAPFLIFGGFLVLVAIGLSGLSRGLPGLVPFLAGWAFAAAGGLMRLMLDLGLGPVNRLTVESIYWGAGGASLAFTIAVAARIRADRRNQEWKLALSEDRYARAMTAANEGLFDFHPATGLRYLSPRVAEILGAPVATALESENPIFQFTHAEDYARVRAAWDHRISLRAASFAEVFRIVRASDAETRWVAMEALIEYDAQGGIARAVGALEDITARTLAELSLKAGEARLRAIVDGSPDAVAVLDDQGFAAALNARAETLFGWTQGELAGRKLSDVLATQTAEHGLSKLIHEGESERGHLTETMIRNRSGRLVPVEVSVTRQLIGGQPFHVLFARDISERRAALARLEASESRYALAVNGTNEGLYDWDIENGDVYYAPRLLSIFGTGLSVDRAVPGAWLEFVFPEDRDRVRAEIVAFMKGTQDRFTAEFRILRDGEVRFVRATGAAQRNDKGRVIRIAGSMGDVTDRKEAEEKLVYDAFHDRLTGLANRAYFLDRLGQMMDRFAKADGTPFVMIHINIDRFKTVNDDLGHRAGDEYLLAIARRLQSVLAPADLLARLGGDEFAVLSAGHVSHTSALTLAGRIRDAVNPPLSLEGMEIFPSASLGIVTHDGLRARAEDLMADAALALMRAKESASSRIMLFDPAMRPRTGGQLALETDLHHALDRGELLLHFQPIVSLSDSRLVGFEALMRWRHPVRGLVGPMEFIPLAETTGQIVRMGGFALELAARQIKAWEERFPDKPGVSISVNVSPRQFAGHDLTGEVQSVLEATGIPPHRLMLEVTESLLMENPDLAAAALRRLKELGVRLSIDDFGTGYSSLSYLQRFPFDRLKIDRSFVSTLRTNQESQVIVRSIATLAHNLGMTIVAEGPEHAEDVAILRSFGCEYAQGFFFGRPVSAEEAIEWLDGTRALEPRR